MIGTVNAINIIISVKMMEAISLDEVLATTLHNKEERKTAEIMVIGTDFCIKPIPTAIRPILAAENAISIVMISVFCDVSERWKEFFYSICR